MFDSVAHRTKKAHSALGGRSLTLYCASNARSAASTESPRPTIPSSTLGPSSAIQSPLRNDKLGRRSADGLSGCAAQYDSIPSNALRARSAPSNITKKIKKFCVCCQGRTIRRTVDLCINKNPMLASDSAHAMRDHTARQTMPDTQIQAASATQISYGMSE